MKQFFTLLLFAPLFMTALITAPKAMAGDSPDMIAELFTSQGCSSCPPSNDLITKWARDADVLALTYSVEYWDYLGWKDTFADPTFSDRQRAYATALGHGRVYTPQIVLAGRMDKPRFTERDVKAAALPLNRPEMHAEKSVLTIAASPDMDGRAAVRLVTYTPGTQTVAVRRGENHGRKLTLTNVVTDIRDLGNYGGAKADYKLPPLSGGHAYAVIVQSGDFGPVLAAYRFTAAPS